MFSLITGANGFIGSHLARKLVARGDRVRCLVRQTSDLTLLKGIDVELSYGDITEPATLPAAVGGVQAVYHLAGIRRSPSPADFERINVQGTRHVLDAVAAMGTPARVVFAGSLAAMGPSTPDRPHVEDDPQRPLEWYGESNQRPRRSAASSAQGSRWPRSARRGCSARATGRTCSSSRSSGAAGGSRSVAGRATSR